MAPWRRVAALVWLGGSASFVVPPGAGRVATSVRSAETSDLEEEARIREKLEEWSTRPGGGRKWQDRLAAAQDVCEAAATFITNNQGTSTFATHS